MMKFPSRFAQRLPAIAMIAAVMAISGCQKEAETTSATDTQSTSTEATNSQASTAPVATETAATTDQQSKNRVLK